MAGGDGCAVVVGTGVMVGVVAATMAEGEDGGCGSWQKKREDYHNTVHHTILCYLKINLNVPQQQFHVYCTFDLNLQPPN